VNINISLAVTVELFPNEKGAYIYVGAMLVGVVNKMPNGSWWDGYSRSEKAMTLTDATKGLLENKGYIE
jgi:hypothetical protein